MSMRGMLSTIGKERLHDAQRSSVSEGSRLPLQLGQRKNSVNGSCCKDIVWDRINKIYRIYRISCESCKSC